MVGIGNKVDMDVLKAIATRYPFGDTLLLPCAGRVKSWRQFKKGMRKAARLLRKGKKTGKGN